MRALPALLAVLALGAAQPATAQAPLDTGNEILQRCDAGARADPVNAGWCLGYVRGLMNGYRWLDTALGTQSCIPESVTLGQLRDALVAYAREKPQDNSMVLLARLVARKWPCGVKS